MKIKKAYDILEALMELERGNKWKRPRFGSFGFWVKKSDVKKMEKLLKSWGPPPSNFEKILFWLLESIKQGYRQVIFLKRGIRARY